MNTESESKTLTATAAPDERKAFADVEAVLAQNLPGYEHRPQQAALAVAIESALADNEHLLAEAGTGIGKSLGYLIPAILAAVQDGQRSAVSTATKALQDQVALQDLPFLQTHLATAGINFTYALLKGRSNYACMAQIHDAENAGKPLTADVLRVIDENASDPKFMGERDDLPDMDDAQWRGMTVTASECVGRSACPFGSVCLSEKAKATARDSQIVVINHALFLTDLKIGMDTDGDVKMLGPFDNVLIDELHELPDYAGMMFGARIGQSGVRNLCSKSINAARATASDTHLETVQGAVSGVTGAMADLWAVLDRLDLPKQARLRINTIEEYADEFAGFVNALGALDLALRSPLMLASANANVYERAVGALGPIRSASRNLYGNSLSVLADSFTETVRWVEDENPGRKGERRRVIKTAPISVAETLRDHLFTGPDHPTVVGVSATLSVGDGGFKYISETLGVDSPRTLDVGTPFDYQRQAALYIPGHLPDPGREGQAWQGMVTSEILALLKSSRGRALVLFTSYRSMQQAADSIRGRVPQKVLMQGERPNRQLAAEFVADESSILLGTRSFMTGVDFPGNALSLVIIDKLPFSVPTEPLFEAKSEQITARGGNSFGDLTLPVMTLVLKQAHGRLIRRSTDAGVVAILDPRLKTKGYGRGIVRALPDSPALDRIEQVDDFYRANP